MIFDKDKILLEKRDCDILKEMIKNNKTKNNIKENISRTLNIYYLEEKNFVLFNVIFKNARKKELTVERTTIGYLLQDNLVYDFISNKTFEVYELYKQGNETKEGEYALALNFAFQHSKRKIKITPKNLSIIESLFKEYIDEYLNNQAYVKKYAKELENEEHIPKF